jgi:uncharacterized NAD(P)/FAD-binding protein YdhS
MAAAATNAMNVLTRAPSGLTPCPSTTAPEACPSVATITAGVARRVVGWITLATLSHNGWLRLARISHIGSGRSVTIKTTSVAIIGGGPAAIATAWALRSAGLVGHLDIFDEDVLGSERGRGTPYQTDPLAPLLNAPLKYMSVDGDDPEHCVRWFRESRNADDPITSDSIITRPAYGEYLTGALDEIASSGHVRLRPTIAHAVYAQGDAFVVHGLHCELGTYDAVILCTGWSRPHSAAPGSYLTSVANRIVGHDDIHIMGSGLAAIDVARVALSHSTARVTMGSRRAILPTVRQIREATELQVLTTRSVLNAPTFGLRDLVGALHDEASVNKIDLEPLLRCSMPLDHVDWLTSGLEQQHDSTWRGLIVRLAEECLTPAWTRFSHRDRRVLLRFLHPYIQAACNPMPGIVAETLVAAMKSERLAVRRIADGCGVDLRTALIIDCRREGGHDFGDVDAPVVRSLLHQSLVARHPLGGLLTDTCTNRLISRDGRVRPLYAVGALTQGNSYMVNALDVIVRQAGAVARDVCGGLP